MIVEDSRSGLQFFKKATEDHDLECISSNGKSGIVKLLEQHKGKRILVIADAAALGSEIKELMYLRSVSNNKIDLFLPESFEWLILRSAIFDRNDNVQEILADPAEHIDCEKYFSWERFLLHCWWQKLMAEQILSITRTRAISLPDIYPNKIFILF